MNSPERILEHFGYTDDWLRLGVVTPSELQQQFAEFEASDDKNKEHYRCGAFRAYLDRLDSISDELLRRILGLSDFGSDGCDLKVNRVFDLVHSELLTDAQLQGLIERSEFREHQSFKIAIARLLIRRRLDAGGLTDDIFRDVCELNDATALQQLLDRDDLARDHVGWVAEHGCNKRLRNIAKQMLQSRRFRGGG